MVVSHFSKSTSHNDDFWGVRVLCFWHQGHTKGEVRVIWQEEGSEEPLSTLL